MRVHVEREHIGLVCRVDLRIVNDGRVLRVAIRKVGIWRVDNRDVGIGRVDIWRMPSLRSLLSLFLDILNSKP